MSRIRNQSVVGSNEPQDLLDQGFQLHQRGKLDEAVRLYRILLDQFPQHVDALHLTGLVHHQQKRFHAAIDYISRAISAKVEPCAILLTNLGAAYQESTHLLEAEHCYRQALQQNPSYLTAQENFCRLLTRMGRVDESAAAWCRLGNLQLEQGLSEAAYLSFRFANELVPNNANTLHDTATALAQIGKLQEAIQAYRASLAQDPKMAMTWNNLGWVLFQTGKLDEAIVKFRRAIELQPDYAEAHACLGMSLLRQGRLDEGWSEYEWRWKTSAKQFAKKDQRTRAWQGEVLDEECLLVECEQGLGDVLQFLRFIPEVKKRAGNVVVQCPKALEPLLRSCLVCEVPIVSDRVEPSKHDRVVSLLSLPYLLKPTTDEISAAVPCLNVPHERVAEWQRRLGSDDRFRIGIVWQGNASYADDRQRSYALNKISPLALIPDVELICLQKGAGLEQVAQSAFPIRQLGDDFDSRSGPFIDSAAVMTNLDLVVAPNTAIAHLAGSLGVSVAMMLSASATDWRWVEGQSKTFWYPSMTIYRQPTPGDWDSAFCALYRDVAEQVAKRVRGE